MRQEDYFLIYYFVIARKYGVRKESDEERRGLKWTQERGVKCIKGVEETERHVCMSWYCSLSH